MAGLIRGSDLKFYGTTMYGGTNNAGTVFSFTTSGTFTPLHSFTGGTNGAYPTTRLVQTPDGFLYGVALSGANGSGTVFRVGTNGSFSVVGPCPNENYLASELVQGTNAALLGTTTYGGDAGIDGCLYSISPINPATYTWSIINGTITSGTNSPAMTWTAGHAGMATISLMITNPITHCTVTASTNILVFGNRIAAGTDFSLALQADGTLWGWGVDSPSYQLGNNSTASIRFPTNVSSAFCNEVNISNLVTVAAGYDYGLAVDSNGDLWSWGDNQYGQLGNGTYLSPQQVPSSSALSNVVSVAAGWQHTLALCTNGTVWATGTDWDAWEGGGRLGVGGLPSPYYTNTPMQSLVPTGTRITAVAAGFLHSLALDSSSNVWAWGDNAFGQLGLGSGAPSSTNRPAKLSGISNVMAIAAGAFHSIAATADGRVWSWGDNSIGELGRNTASPTSPAPGLVAGALSNQHVVAVTAGSEFSAALTSNGYLYAWGSYTYGELGTNTNGQTNAPVQVPGISNVAFVSAHPLGNHCLATTRDQGTEHFWGWGNNSDGEVGDYSYANIVDPPAGPLQFCDTCVQLGTSGTFTAHGTGTLTLFFNDNDYSDNTNGSYIVTITGLTNNVTVWASNSLGVAVGTVSNGFTYSYSASGYCLRGGDCIPGGYATCYTDADGNDQTTHALVGCANGGAVNACHTPCPSGICYSLVGDIALIPSY
jgi:uncharacterized repeat protein (TIGR03803 family)